MKYLCSALEMAELDRQTIEEFRVPGRVLMETAGRAIAEAARTFEPRPRRISVLAGPGNNGGDGFVAARSLAARGFEVAVEVLAERGRLSGDSREAFIALEREGRTKIEFVDDAKKVWELSLRLESTELLIDAILGTGLRDDVRGVASEAIDIINRGLAPVLAVDIPSGIDADTGAVRGRAVRASKTITFAYAKRGHHLFPGRDYCGELSVVDIGIPSTLATQLQIVGRVADESDGPQLLPPRRGDSHKGVFGHALVVGGADGKPGAAHLACLGALRAGAGLVSLAPPGVGAELSSSLPPEVMVRRRGEKEADTEWANRIMAKISAVVVGPGFGTEGERVRELELVFQRAASSLCIDADGLNILASHPELWDQIAVPAVVTPHPKEMARLVNSSVAEVQRDRFASALQLAMGRGCVVVLKGAGTVVADPEGTVTVVDAGNPGMATGGTGDVLAGVIGAFLAQGHDPLTSAQLGALLHGCAGDRAAKRVGEAGMLASDLAAELGPVLADWGR